jgi:ribosomal protein S12 methylthiotransferase accessory factor
MDIIVTFEGNKKVNAQVGKFLVRTDQPVSAGGEDTYPAPYELFLASMATCAGIYVKGYCDNRGISTEGITLTQKHEFDEKGLATKIDIIVNLPKDFPEKNIDSVIHVAGLCKVKKQILAVPEMNIKAIVE